MKMGNMEVESEIVCKCERKYELGEKVDHDCYYIERPKNFPVKSKSGVMRQAIINSIYLNAVLHYFQGKLLREKK